MPLLLACLLKSHTWKPYTSVPQNVTVFGIRAIKEESKVQFSSVQSLSCVSLRSQASLAITNSRSLLKLMSIESVMPSNHLILCRPLLLPSFFPSVRWPKYWCFSLSISPSNEHPGLISFRMDWLDLLAVQGLSRVFWCSVLLM